MSNEIINAEFENVSSETLEQELVAPVPATIEFEVDVALLIGEFLKGKEVSENDSLNLELFLKGDISGWRFENIPAPSLEELKTLEPQVLQKQNQDKTNAEAQKFLDESDWKVLRHRDQQELGLATSLSSDEFQELLRQRQMAREAIVK